MNTEELNGNKLKTYLIEHFKMTEEQANNTLKARCHNERNHNQK